MSAHAPQTRDDPAPRRVALVTGAGGGLGAAFATAVARQGCRVVVNNRNRWYGEPSAERVTKAIRAEGLEAIADLHAINEPGAAEATVAATVAAYGRLDALVLNAGVNGQAARVGAMTDADLREVMDINFFANVALVNAALPFLRQAGAGRVLFVSSTAGLYGLRGRAHYAASKGAITAYALTLADELRSARIGVNIVMPYAATQMTAGIEQHAGVDLSPEHVAPLAAWLTSARCEETGQIWVAGAGRFRRAFSMETEGLTFTRPTAEALAQGAEVLAAQSGAKTFAGGEAAFNDFIQGIRER